MIKVLIVDDDFEKTEQVRAVLLGVDGVDRESIVTARDVFAAKARLSGETFDLALVDMFLPLRDGLPARADGGQLLLEELHHGSSLRMPGHVVGITAFESASKVAAELFPSALLSVLMYRREESSWREHLAARVRQIVASRASVQPEYLTTLGVVCALDSELDGVKTLPWDWKAEAVPADHALYWRGKWTTAEGVRSAVAVAAPRMGLPAAAIAASKLISQFRPRFIAMTGICAGVRNKTKMGQVVVADPCWDYGSGKWTREGDHSVFEHAPHQLALNVELKSAVKRLSAQRLAGIRASWLADKPEGELTVVPGPFASGASVLADGTTIGDVNRQHRQLLAIDMEAYAIHLAAEEAAQPRPTPIVLKAVVDHADSEKKDAHQKYGSFVSAHILAALLESVTVDH